MIKISIIIPVYNRPEELSELLMSISRQNNNDFEVIVVEDGSTVSSEQVCLDFKSKIDIQYITQNNTGPGIARNTGANKSEGDWLIFLDSDCILPDDYLEIVNEKIVNESFDCFGGPDKAHESFNSIQKAIGYAMSSILTTGGIRGSIEKMDKFYPRSYNLGVKKDVFASINGFSEMRFGEDIDFSMRLLEKGFTTKLLKEVFVYHKRRNNFNSFFKQVYNSGIARINLEIRHPKTIKLVHWLPSFFVIGNLLIALSALLSPTLLLLLTVIPVVILIHSATQTKEFKTSILAVVASFVQLFGYGLGFIKALIFRKIFKKEEFHSFNKNFYGKK